MANTTPITLKVKDLEPREVLAFDYSFDQIIDDEGQVNSKVRGGFITIRVKAMNDGNNQLLVWLLNEYEKHDLEIEILSTATGKPMKTIKGEGCYCVNYTECWEDKQPHFEEIIVSCQNISNGAKFENFWK